MELSTFVTTFPIGFVTIHRTFGDNGAIVATSDAVFMLNAVRGFCCANCSYICHASAIFCFASSGRFSIPFSKAPPNKALNGADTIVEGIAIPVASDFSGRLYGDACASVALFTPDSREPKNLWLIHSTTHGLSLKNHSVFKSSNTDIICSSVYPSFASSLIVSSIFLSVSDWRTVFLLASSFCPLPTNSVVQVIVLFIPVSIGVSTGSIICLFGSKVEGVLLIFRSIDPHIPPFHAQKAGSLPKADCISFGVAFVAFISPEAIFSLVVLPVNIGVGVKPERNVLFGSGATLLRMF